ncbi:MAG: hypothetical protein ACMXYC_01525 [Candidatus Woesearchaeota archaeon]
MKQALSFLVISLIASIVLIITSIIYFGVTLWIIKIASMIFFGEGLDINWAVLAATIMSTGAIIASARK